MSTSVDVQVDPVAFRALRQELFAFDRELLGKLNSRLKRAVEPARQAAESNASALGTMTDSKGRPGGLMRTYNRGRKDVTVKVGGRTSRAGNDAVVRLQVRGKAPAVAEFARNSRTPQGEALIRRLSRFGGPGRFAWQAVDDRKQQILTEIRAEVRKTEREFTDRLSAGISKGVIR